MLGFTNPFDELDGMLSSFGERWHGVGEHWDDGGVEADLDNDIRPHETTQRPTIELGPFMGQASDSSQNAFDSAQIERDRTLICVRQVEDALSRAGGSETWHDDLKSSLSSLKAAMIEEQRELDRPASLLALIAGEDPRRFGPRVRGIREQYNDIGRQLDSFRQDLDHRGDAAADIDDLRHRTGWIIQALHHCRNRQADLVFEALGRDLGRKDGE